MVSDSILHVLHVASSLDRRHGGPTVALEELVCAQIREGLKVSVLATDASGAHSVANALAEAGGNVAVLPGALPPLRWDPRLHLLAKRLVEAASIVHVHGVWEAVQAIAGRAARRAHVPYVIEPCGMLSAWSLEHHATRKRAAWRLWARRLVDGAAFVQVATRREGELLAPLGIRAPRFVAPIGTSLVGSTVAPRTVVERIVPALGARPFVLFLGRVAPGKGVSLLMRAHAASAARESHAVVVAGPADDSFREELRREAQNLGIGGDVHFAGAVWGAEKVALLTNAAVLALPSEHENFGIVVAEALACGAQVLVSDAVGLAEDLVGMPFATVAPLNVAAMSRGIEAAIVVHGVAERSAAAREFANKHFGWPTIAKSIARRYAEAVS